MYNKQNFTNGSVLTADNLIKIEDAILESETLISNYNFNSAQYFYYDFDRSIGDFEKIKSGFLDENLSSSGYALGNAENMLQFDYSIVLDYIKMVAMITIPTTFNASVVFGSITRNNTKHGTNIVFDFSNKQMIVCKQSISGDPYTLPTAYRTIDISTLIENTSDFRFFIEVGRKRRCVYCAITNYRTGKRIETLIEEEGDHVLYPCGWLYDYPMIYQLSGEQVYLNNFRCQIPTNLDFVFMGDSITEGHSVKSESCWATRCCDYFGNSINMGRSGGKLPDDLEKQVEQLLPILKPKYVVVTIGTNGGNTTDNLNKLVENIKSINAVPIINRIYRKSSSVTEVNDMIAALHVLSARFDYATSVDNKLGNAQNLDLYTSDKVHPNEKGHDVLFNRFLSDCGFLKFSKF